MTSSDDWSPLEGGCPCTNIRYRVERPPLIVHCCHCRSCQKETGSAFALNYVIEAKYVKLLTTESPEVAYTPSDSGNGQRVSRCQSCRNAVWSNYGHSGDIVRFLKVGTLDDPSKAPPGLHIYLQSKQPWVKVDDSIPCLDEFYDREEYWSKASLQRMDDLIKSLR